MRNLYIVPIIVLLSACSSLKQSDFVGVWKFNGISDKNIEQKDSAIDSTFSYFLKQNSEEYLANSFVNFYTPKHFTFRIGNRFYYGMWKYDSYNENILLISETDTLYIAVDEFDGKGSMKCALPNALVFSQTKRDSIDQAIDDGLKSYFPKQLCLCDFEKDTFTYNNADDNIYSLENNSWRIKPMKKETQKQILERLKSNIHYIMIFLNNANIRNDETINLSALNSPILIGGNGISLIDFEEVPREWIQIFYNKQQAENAYNMLVMAFLRGINVPTQDNWIELNVSLLHQIYKKL